MKRDLTPIHLKPGASLQEVIDAYNDLADKFEFLSTKLSFRNFDGQILEVSLAAGEEKRITHNLGVKPQYRVILSQSGNGVITDDPLKANNHFIFLKNNGSVAVKAKVLLVKE